MSRARRFDAAHYLDTPQARAAYLQMAFESNDAVEVVEALAAIARASGMTRTARKVGLGRDPDLETVLCVLAELGLRLEVAPVRQRAE